ncbi:MAG: penicillin-binding protein 2 [Candidatus Pelagibacter sp.]
MINSGEGGFTKKRNIVSRRMFILTAAKVIIFGGIITRLFSLQINNNKKYLNLSDENRLREWRLPPVRGDFKDYFGNTIAGNVEIFQLHVVPEEVTNFKVLMFRLRKILNLSDNEYRKIIKKKNSQKPWETLIISNNLSWDEFSKINLYLHELNGAKPVLSIARNYPFKDNYSHVLGYVSQASVQDINRNEIIKNNHVPGLKVGKTGLEKTYEKKLIGTNGVQRYEVNAFGKRVKELDHEKGKKGENIRITIDTEIQKFLTESLKDKSGSISVMDIFTGEIIAIQSSPTFDPNMFIYGIGNEEWKKITKNPLKPLLNKTLSGLYSPGSTIKPIVALSALENNVINKNFKVRCSGKIELFGQTYHCWKDKGHGLMDLRNAVKQSCDTYFYEVARLLGVDRLKKTAENFGLGKKVLENSFLEEKQGIVPSTEWKKNVIGKNWVLGETLITGIGQGYIQTTPLQLCLMTAQLANGGYKIKPKIIADKNQMNANQIKFKMKQNFIKNKFDKTQNLLDRTQGIFQNKENFFTPLFKDKKNIDFVLDSMYGATNEIMGTSYSSRIEDDFYQFAGKTGTAQVKRITEEARELDLKTSEIPYEDRDHALYIAFGPYKDPRYAVSIIIEHGGSGSSAAAPIAKDLFKLIIDRHQLRENKRNEINSEENV